MRVLVTRPEPGASRTAATLLEMGHQPLVMSLTRTIALKVSKAKLQAGGAGAFAVTSAAAIACWHRLGIDPQCFGMPLYVVGSRTEEAAMDAGFLDVRMGGGDGRQLVAVILGDLDSGKLWLSSEEKLVYVAGKIRHGCFEDGIRAEKLPILLVEVYDTQNISYSTDFVSKLFMPEPPDAIAFYSRNTGEAFFHLVERENLFNRLKKCRFLCLSGQVSGIIPDQFRGQILIAAFPDEASLLALLDSGHTLS